MPYMGEFSKNQGNQKAMSDLAISEIFKDVKIIQKNNEFARLDDFVAPKLIKPRDSAIKYIFVIDGSKYDTTLPNSDMSLGLVNINQCVIDMDNMLAYLQKSFPLPQEYEKLKEDVVMNFLLPLKGLASSQYKDEKQLFRAFIFQLFERQTNPVLDWLSKKGFTIAENETLLDTYLHLLSHKPKITNFVQPCPICRKAGRSVNLKSFKDNQDNLQTQIQCKCDIEPETIYITDLLQFYEQLNNEHSNEALTTQIMLVLEKMTMINLLRNLKLNSLNELLNTSAFIMDGSLALYSHASWLSQAINDEIFNLRQSYNILLMGVEKTGNFVEHLKKVDNSFQDTPLKSGMIYYLNDQYIKNYIKVYDNDSFYGEKNYFGKKLFYKNSLGKLFVVNVAFEDEADRSVHYNDRHNPERIANTPRLNDLVMLLENFSSQAYNNALSFISLANDGASLSSSPMGRRLLDESIAELLSRHKS